MTRNLKALGLAVVAALAMSAFAAQAAQAEGALEDANITLAQSPAAIEGEQINGLHVLERSGRKVHCETAKFNGEAETGDTSITLTPEYGGCTSPGVGPATVNFTPGCDYDFNLKKTTTASGDDYRALASLNCKHEDVVHVSIYTSTTNHTNNAPLCEFTFGDTDAGKTKTVNQNLGTINLTNVAAAGETPDHIVAEITVGGIYSTRTVGSALLCGPATNETATLNGEAILEARAGELVGGTLSTDTGL